MINKFRDEYSFLSNFYQCSFIFDGKEYPTAEHAYQAQKTLNKNDREKIRTLETPAEAKKMGRKVLVREDWENIKIDIMKKIVKEKFSQNPYLREKLLKTHDHSIKENNYWGDRFWGVYRGKGRNELGKILMLIREEFYNEEFK